MVYSIQNEIKELRNLNSKVFKENDGSRSLVVSRYPIHYRDDDGVWRNIDLTIDDNNEVTKGLYKASLLKNDIGYSVVSRKDGSRIDVKLKSIGGKTISYKEPEVKDNCFGWIEIVDDIDFIIEFTPYRIRCWKKVKSETAPKDIVFTVIEDDREKDLNIIEDIISFDDNGNRLKISKNKTKRFKFTTKNTKTNVNKYEITQIFKNKSIVRNERTRVQEESDEVKYPLFIDADVQVGITITSDDGMAFKYDHNGEAGWSTMVTNNYTTRDYNYISYVRTGGGSSAAQTMSQLFTRFQGITIPQSETINTAYLNLYGGRIGLSNTFKIYAFDENNPVIPTNAIGIINKTTGFVPYTVTTSFTNNITDESNKSNYILKAIDVKDIVQDLVNSYDYSNDEMLFLTRIPTIMLPPPTVNYRNVIYDYTWGSTKAPELVINYGPASSSSSSSSTSSSSSSSSSMSLTQRGFCYHIWYKLLDEEGVPVPSASVWIYDHYNPTTQLIIFDSNLDQITQPLLTTSAGVLDFYVKDHIKSITEGYVWDTQYIVSWSKDDKSGIIRGDHLFGEFESVNVSGNLARLNRAISNYQGWIIDNHVDFNFGVTHRCGSSSSSSSSSISSSSTSSSSESSS